MQNIIVKKSAIGADASNYPLPVARVHDMKKVIPCKRFTTPKIYLKDVVGSKLVDYTEALVKGEFPCFLLARPRKAMDTG
jgi:hypothetical protein